MTKIVLCLIIFMGNLMITHSKDQEKEYNSFQMNYTRSSSSQIYLSGRLATPTSRSISQPIEVFLNSKILNIYFVSYLGKIDIAIMNNCNVIIYHNVVTIQDNMNLSIELNDFAEGDYRIIFTDIEGNRLSGSFFI